MIMQGEWVTDGQRAGVVVKDEVLWLGGGTSPVSDALEVMTPEEAQRALDAAPNESEGSNGNV